MNELYAKTSAFTYVVCGMRRMCHMLTCCLLDGWMWWVDGWMDGCGGWRVDGMDGMEG